MSEFKSGAYLNRLKMMQQKEKAQEALEYTRQQNEEFFDGDEDLDMLKECITKYSKKEIENLDDEGVEKFKTELRDAGFELEPPEYLQVTEKEYFIDMMKYFKENFEFEDRMEKMIDEFETDIEKINEELEVTMQQYSNSVVSLMRDEITKNPKFKDTKAGKLYDGIMDAFDNSYTLDTVKEVAHKVNVQNTIDDYDSESKRESVHKQYKSIIKRLNIQHDMQALFKDIQSKVTDKYDDRPEFLIFLFMKYLAKRGSSVSFSKAKDGVFAAQLVTNLYLLKSNDQDEIIQNKFKHSCEELLDLYLG